MPKIKKTSKKVICPECKGNKTAAYYDETLDYSGYSWKTCRLCGGVGMVMKVKRVEFKKIENAS